jgi:predicted TIM-barrel fold metal-dependent hydrolase
MYKGPIIDVDVHHNWKASDEVIQYLPAFWQEYLSGGSGPRLPISPAFRRTMMVDGAYRLETFPPGGYVPGSDYELMKEQLLDPLGAERSILTYDIGLQSGMPNPQLSSALCRAANQYTTERWLPLDDRLCGMILVPMAVPEDAAAEIEHWAGNERMVGVLLVMNVLQRPFGHPIYDPIYRAATEHGLPVVSHLSGSGEGGDSAGGNVTTLLETYPIFGQAAMHHLTSMISCGLFEKFPSLKVMFTEWGFTWLPAVAKRLDAIYPVLKAESPHVRRRPSEVIREHIRFSTQPFDYVPAPALAAVLGALDGMEDILCFSSDYPHWDADEPARIATRLPKSWHHKVFYENAARFFGFDRTSREAALPSSGRHA